MQPVAAVDVSAELTKVAVAPPVNGTLELAGPTSLGQDELVRRVLKAKQDPRQVVADSKARYFGTELDDQSLRPGKNPRVGAIDFEKWLRESVRA